MSVDRRDFIKTAGAATAATALSYSRILGANERVRLGLIGCGSRGVGDMNNFLKLGNVDAVALSDVYSAQVDVARKSAPSAKTCRTTARCST
jgi:predicted homoserine dehydrogenase-like protein